MSRSAAAGSLPLPRTITDAYNLMCTELQQQRKNRDQAGLAYVHTTATHAAQMSSGGSDNSEDSNKVGSNNGGRSGRGALLCYICDSSDHGYRQYPLFWRSISGHNGKTGGNQASYECIDATNLAQQTTSQISRNLIVIDYASACHLFFMAILLITSHPTATDALIFLLWSDQMEETCNAIGCALMTIWRKLCGLIAFQ